MPAAKVITYRVLSSVTNAEDLTVNKTVFATHDEQAFNEVLASIKGEASTKPKLRPATNGNSRKIKLVEIADVREFVARTKNGDLPEGLAVGHEWPTLLDAAAAVGLRPATLKQLFYIARRDAEGVDSPVTTRGLVLAYADIDDPLNNISV